jgi:hypothetical protein
MTFLHPIVGEPGEMIITDQTEWLRFGNVQCFAEADSPDVRALVHTEAFLQASCQNECLRQFDSLRPGASWGGCVFSRDRSMGGGLFSPKEVVQMIATVKKSRGALRGQKNEKFLEFVPFINNLARLTFRTLPREEREEAVREVLAHAFCAFRRLVELGKQDVAFASPLARFAVARVRAGRRVGSKLHPSDVFSWLAQRRHVFRLTSVETAGGKSDTWAETLVDNTLTPIPDQVAFRMDFAAWLAALDRRSRNLVALLALGNSSSEAAQQFHLSGARISQLRSALQASWQAFQGEDS